MSSCLLKTKSEEDRRQKTEDHFCFCEVTAVGPGSETCGPPGTRCPVGGINHHQRWRWPSCGRTGPLPRSLLIKSENGNRNQLHCRYEREHLKRNQVRRLSAVFDDGQQLHKYTKGHEGTRSRWPACRWFPCCSGSHVQ